jgi:hypothetical protein
VIEEKRDPREHPWGHFTYDAIPGLGGTGVFRWHASKEESADELQWIIEQYIEGEGWDSEKKAAARAVLSGVRDGSVEINQAVDRLNADLENLVQIGWWGRYGELRDGDGKFALTLRENIRVSRAEEAMEYDESPVRPSEEEDFMDALHNYGH